MASCFIILKQFDDVLIYLESIKPYCGTDPVFSYNYGVALGSTGKFKEAEEAFLQVQDERLASEYMFISWLVRCFIHNGKPQDAWEQYLKMDSGQVRARPSRLCACGAA
jgi:intraflagellar transport protein 56